MPVPVPGPGEVRVKVAACGLNPVDAKTAQWKGMVAEPKPAIHVPGLDVVGIVDAVASDVTNFKTGQRVLYHGRMLLPGGGFAPYAIADAETLLEVKQEWESALSDAQRREQDGDARERRGSTHGPAGGLLAGCDSR